MYSSLQQWIAAVPGSPASDRLSGGVLTFQSCDPGVGGATVSTDFQPAVDLVTTRTLVGATLLHSGASVPQARCLAGKLVDTYTVAQLNDPAFGANDRQRGHADAAARRRVPVRVRRRATGCPTA